MNPKGNTVQLCTFLKWNLGGVIGHKSSTDDSGRPIVTNVWCKLCARHADNIKKDPRIRGQALTDIDKYIIGTNFITKHSVTRHLGSKSHAVGIEYEELLGSTTDADFDTTKTSDVVKLYNPRSH